MVDEEQLFRALVAGDEEAWTTLAQRIQRQWRQRTVQSVGEGEADDVLQEVFVRVYTHRQEIRDLAHLDSFVGRVWNQRVVDNWRRRGVRERGAARMQAMEPASSKPTSPDPASDALRSELLEQIDRSALLSAEQKLVLKLHILDGLSLAEVARVLQQNAATAQTGYYRALEILRLHIALSGYRARAGDFREQLSEQQRAALDLLSQGLSLKKTARKLGMKVPEVQELLAPALKTLCQVATAECRKIFGGF
jgi:RNA polymerase sigma-70 factor (ECF subfamily)